VKPEKQKDSVILEKEKDNHGNEFSELPLIHKNETCNFQGYDIENLMKETAQLRKLITKRGTLEILIPLCCSNNPVRYLKFRNSMKGFSSKTLAIRLKELERNGVLRINRIYHIPITMDEKMVIELNVIHRAKQEKYRYS
jgi:DNA-binding HxlR family transcriptional regulator